MKKYDLAVIDIDGTLLNDQKEISKHTRAAILKAQQLGVRIALASGRPSRGVKPIAEELDLQNYDGYYLSYNGSKIFEAKGNKTIFEKYVNADIVPFIQRQAKKYGLAIFTYNRGILLTDSPDNEFICKEAELNGMEIVYSENLSEDIDFDIHKIMLVGDPDVLISIEGSLKKRLNGTANVFRSEPYFLEFTPDNIDKANTVGVLLDRLKINPENMLVIGDGVADVKMLQMAGLGIAMGNAQDSVKICADMTTLSNNEEGVAIALEKTILSTLPPAHIILKQLNANTANSLIGNLGIEYTYAAQDRVEAIMPVNEKTRQPFGILHGGASLALAETIAGIGSILNCKPDEFIVGMQVSGNHVSSAHEGDTVRGIATPIHRGRTSHVWNVDVFTSTDKLVSSIRVINTIIKRK